MDEPHENDSLSNDDETVCAGSRAQSVNIAVSEENASDTEEGERQQSSNAVPGTCPEHIVLPASAGRSWRFGIVSVLVFMGWAVIVMRLIQLQGAAATVDE